MGNDTWDLAVRYGRAWGDFEVAAAASQWVKDGDTTGMGGSASLLAPSGTSFTLAYSTEDSGGGADPRFTYAQARPGARYQPPPGARRSRSAFGSTDNQGGAGNSGSYYDVAVVQKLKSLGTELYGIFGVYDAGIVGTSTNDITITGVGARIKF